MALVKSLENQKYITEVQTEPITVQFSFDNDVVYVIGGRYEKDRNYNNRSSITVNGLH